LPELPEVETIRWELGKKILNKRIFRVEIFPDSRGIRFLGSYSPADFQQKLTGRTIKDVRRRGKYLLFSFDSESILAIHLGMTGKLLYRPADTPADKFVRMKFVLSNGYEIRFADPRKFGKMFIISPTDDKLMESLGPEPLSPSFTVDYLQKVLSRHRKKIKEVLLDQKIIAGIGNIYSDEILFRAKIHPERSACSLLQEEIFLLFSAMQEILRAAIVARGTTAGDRQYLNTTGKPGKFQYRLQVYQRRGQECLRCGRVIVSKKFGGRSGYFCPQCQV